MAKIPFDIKYRPQIESGKYKVETRNGLSVRIICWDRKHGHPIVGLAYEKATGCESYVNAYADGTTSANEKLKFSDDLFIVTPDEEWGEFETRLLDWLSDDTSGEIPMERMKELVRNRAAELLSLAREQFIKDGYVIEKKAFHDAVDKIDDKHKAEMSVEYSLHCKVENGTRHAVINWNEFQKVAQHFIDCGKAEAMKDLPRWRIELSEMELAAYGIIGGGVASQENPRVYLNGRSIDLYSLKKLPGFKED